jgi:hypothetical protein
MINHRPAIRRVRSPALPLRIEVLVRRGDDVAPGEGGAPYPPVTKYVQNPSGVRRVESTLVSAETAFLR